MQKIVLSAAAILLVAAPFLVSASAPTKAQRNELRVLDCTLESKDQDDCDLTAYGIRVVTYAVPGFLYAVLTLLLCPFYCMGKVCCNCCGGRQQSQGCCCPVKDEMGNQLPMVYSTSDIVRVKFWLLICTIFVAVAFLWGYVGAAELTSGLTEFGDAIDNIPNILTAQIDDIDDSLVLNSFNESTNGTSPVRLFSTTGNATKAEALEARDTLRDNIDDTLGDYNSRVDQAKEVLWFAFLIPFVIIVFGFLLGMCNCRRIMPMVIVWLLFLFSMLIWICHGAFAAGFFIFSDVCAEVEGIDTQKANVLAQLAGCENSQFSDFRTTFRNLEVTQAEETCSQLAALCYVDSDSIADNLVAGKVFECPATLQCSGMTFASLVELMENVFKIHPTIMTSTLPEANLARCRDTSSDCTVQRCSSNCVVPEANGGYLLDIGLSSAKIYITFLGAKQVSNSIDTLGAKFSNCDSAMKIVLGGLNAPCKKMVGGLRDEMNASGFLAFSLMTGIFVFAWGAKRFISFDLVGKELLDGDVVEETQQQPIE